MNPTIKNIIGALLIVILCGIAIPFCGACAACMMVISESGDHNYRADQVPGHVEPGR